MEISAYLEVVLESSSNQTSPSHVSSQLLDLVSSAPCSQSQVHLMGLAFSNSGEGALFFLALVGCGAVVLIICLQCVVLWKVQALRRPADPTPGGGSGWPAPIDSTARHSPASTATEATEAPEAPVYDNIQLYALPAAHVEAARALGRL